MTLIAKLGGRLAREEDGAALVEYTVLLGILVVAVIVTIVAVGGWISTQWGDLNKCLENSTDCPAADEGDGTTG
jgi:pilus assembly protein Flp/PilA